MRVWWMEVLGGVLHRSIARIKQPTGLVKARIFSQACSDGRAGPADGTMADGWVSSWCSDAWKPFKLELFSLQPTTSQVKVSSTHVIIPCRPPAGERGGWALEGA